MRSARAIGATVITRDRDYEKLKAVLDFRLQVIVNWGHQGRAPMTACRKW